MLEKWVVEYPRMLYRGDATCVVTNADEKAAKLAAGWTAILLPGEESPEEAPAKPEPVTDIASAPRRGRPRKLA